MLIGQSLSRPNMTPSKVESSSACGIFTCCIVQVLSTADAASCTRQSIPNMAERKSTSPFVKAHGCLGLVFDVWRTVACLPPAALQDDCFEQ